ncbi:MAG: helix-turn-helix domain-containing protein [Erysipelotrichaceae bacterium]|nr:helix-turn-helix domain-containing protein [Erysipelotrichaceae bacterium]
MVVKSRTFIATPPGETIKEQLVDRGISQKEFARRMNMSEKHMSKLINGEVILTPDVAVRLEMVLGIPAYVWNNLESIYREKLIKVNDENQMDADKEIIKKLPYNEMSKLDWVPETRKPSERVINLRKFFEVVNLELITDKQLSPVACRQLSKTEKSDYALLAWAQQAKLEARKIETSSINLKALKKDIPDIRKMTMENPEDFSPKLMSILSNCGIALVFLPHLDGSFLHGATFKDGKKIVMGLTVRGKYADKFWFSLFHELGHILLGHINHVDGLTDEDEQAADDFASNSLIDNESFENYVKNYKINKDTIINFSKDYGIDSGILVGRLQKDGYIPYNRYNSLKKKYIIDD